MMPPDTNFELLRTRPLITDISCAEIFRLKQGEDHVYLHTNLRNPRSPYVGCLMLHVIVDRGCGPDWVHGFFPGVETHLYDHAHGRTKAHNPAPFTNPVSSEANQPAVVAAA